MPFTTPLFVLLFLPVVLILYLVIGRRFANLYLLVVSLIFYLWGEAGFFPVFILCILVNYILGKQIERFRETRWSKWLTTVGVVFNIGMLATYKNLFPFWLGKTINVMGVIHVPVPQFMNGIADLRVNLPLGISFFTFAAVTYLVDIDKKRSGSEKSLFNFALYFALFPKMLAGPIVRYREIAKSIPVRIFNSQNLAEGARRFILGLSKKVLIADTVGQMVDSIFSLEAQQVSPGLAWLGIIAYTVQIYYDFSGYSDMAIGIGKLFGFTFIENFNYPYISKSISEFWRRWHISLSNWFRDYLFYPLERNRKKLLFNSQYITIFIVFFMTGLWHGNELRFILWGVLHGAAIMVERTRFGKWLESTWKPLQHIYALLVVMVAWVFFRSPNLGYAVNYLKAMVGLNQGLEILPFKITAAVSSAYYLIALGLGIFLAFPILQAPGLQGLINRFSAINPFTTRVVQDFLLIIFLILSVLTVAGGTHQAFIYMRF